MLAAFNLDSLLKLTPDQVRRQPGAAPHHRRQRRAADSSSACYGGVIVGFQRYDLNNLTSIATSIAVALANVAVLLAGYGVVDARGGDDGRARRWRCSSTA